MPAPKKPDTYESEMKALRNLALEPADRQNRAAKIAVKYGRQIRMAGKVFGPKPKTKAAGLGPNKKAAIKQMAREKDMFIYMILNPDALCM